MTSRSPQVLIFLLLLCGGVILLLQNSQSLGLVIFNRPLLFALPLGVWVILAVTLGIIISVILQVLIRIQEGLPPIKAGDRLNERLESLKQRPPRQPDNRTGRSDWERSRANYDWTDKELEEADAETWDIESPPQRPTPVRPPKAAPEPSDREQEVSSAQPSRPARPRPEPSTPEDSNTPPRRRTSRPPTQGKGDGVYDADYRVITPPYNPEDSQPGEQIEDDPEWI
jgi:hypothetical protein